GSYDAGVGVVYLPDGKLLVAGYTYGTQTSPGAVDFVRYNPNGTLDQTFGEGGIIYYLSGSINSTPFFGDMIRQPDGKLLIHGTGYFARYNADTTLDTTFGTNGYVYGSPGGKMNVQPDGKLLISGYAGQQYSVFSLSRFKPDGSPDVNFGTNGTVLTPFRRNTIGYADAQATQAAVKSNGEIVVVGLARLINTLGSGDTTSAMAVADYSSTGTLIAKTAIAFPPYPESYGYAIAVQPDDKVIIAGLAGLDAGIARLTSVTNDPRLYRRIYNFNGYMSTDLMIYRPGSGGNPSVWYNYNDTSTAPAFGQEGDIIAPADYNDDGVTDIAVFRPSNGTWYIASSNYDPLNHFTAVQWGADGDVPVAGDYDGDGKADVAVFRPSNGYWYILNSADNTAKIEPFGVSGDKPVVGDYDGDGKCDFAIFRPSNGTWYIAKSTTGEYQIVQFGANGDIPAQNDYDGDHKTDLVVFRPSTGAWYTSTDPSTNYGAIQFGLSGDVPVVGDYDGDGKADIAVWRPSNRFWYVLQSTNGQVFSLQWGASTDIPVPGN
ncbi:MAG: VCBS repeat-containing protein, partial [Acidobacteria bacterium]|nr:VCBS repeat-containing protein [Acidobacteriota bacterium]